MKLGKLDLDQSRRFIHNSELTNLRGIYWFNDPLRQIRSRLFTVVLRLTPGGFGRPSICFCSVCTSAQLGA